MNKIDLILLMGGAGKRMQSLSKKRPKALMPIGDITFLDMLIGRLEKFQIDDVILSLHYKAELFLNHLKKTNYSNFVTSIIEPKPFGTGGAIKYVIDKRSISNPFLALNGDTITETNFDLMKTVFDNSSFDAMIGISHVNNTERYGTVQFEGNNIEKFIEKGRVSSGWINNGHYVMKKSIFDSFSGNFSLEYDVFPQLAEEKKLGVFPVQGDNFIDMGIPKDYEKLCKMYTVLD